jgi:hypothetical protein
MRAHGGVCVGGGVHPPLVVSSIPLEKSGTTLKNLLDHTFSAFRIAILAELLLL